MEEQINAVRKIQKYIDEHYSENITMDEIAEIANYSKWHTHRIFIQYLKMTPAKYIRRLRLSKSALKIASGEAKITDTAFAFGFNSVDGYQRAFLKEFGCNPKEYAKNPIALNLFVPKKIYNEEKTIMKSTKIFISLILCFAFGFGGGYLVKSKFSNNENQNTMSFTSAEVSSALNGTYSQLNNQNLSVSLPDNKVLVKSNEKNLEAVVNIENSAELIENVGSVVSNGSISMELKDLSNPVFEMINELFKRGAYDLMSATLLFEVRDADMMPADFDLKIKMTGFQNGIGLEYYISYEGGSSYSAIYLGLNENASVKTITSLYIEGATLLYGIYDVEQNITYTLNPEYVNYSSYITELNNVANVMKYTSGTLKTGIDIVEILSEINN